MRRNKSFIRIRHGVLIGQHRSGGGQPNRRLSLTIEILTPSQAARSYIHSKAGAEHMPPFGALIFLPRDRDAVRSCIPPARPRRSPFVALVRQKHGSQEAPTRSLHLKRVQGDLSVASKILGYGAVAPAGTGRSRSSKSARVGREARPERSNVVTPFSCR
jgi:hypothetical protein